MLQAQISQEKQGVRMLEKNEPYKAVRLMDLLEKQSMLMHDNIITDLFMHR